MTKELNYGLIAKLSHDPDVGVLLVNPMLKESDLDKIVVIMFIQSKDPNYFDLSNNLWYLSQGFVNEPVSFLTADLELNEEKANTLNVTVTPTYLLFKRHSEIDRYEGGDIRILERKIKSALLDLSSDRELSDKTDDF